MTDTTKLSTCQTVCWGLAGLTGVMVLLDSMQSLGLIAGVLLGLAVAVVLGVLFRMLVCTDYPSDDRGIGGKEVVRALRNLTGITGYKAPPDQAGAMELAMGGAPKRAAAAESLYKYGQTLLTAVREVEDALSNEQKQRRALAGIRRQLRLSKQPLQQLGRKYRNGAVDFLKVLDEQRRYQTLQRQALTAHVRLVQDRINLYRALAGTWDLERPEKNRHGEDNAAKKGENQESSGDEANKKPASESGL